MNGLDSHEIYLDLDDSDKFKDLHRLTVRDLRGFS